MDKTRAIEKAASQLILPRLISNGMVLQRAATVRIWGWADPGETVTVDFISQKYKTLAGDDGCWEVFLKDLEAGGPYDMEIKASATIVVRDILVGEVWVCSGQSNIELMMERVKDQYPEDIINCSYPEIRHFSVVQRYDFNKSYSDFSDGCWEAACPETIRRFSAVGYFFAKAIHEKYNVPVGFIKAAIGGSPIESWISEEALAPHPEAIRTLLPYKDEEYVKKVLTIDEKITGSWQGSLNRNDAGLTDKEPWYAENIDTSDWTIMELPANFYDEGLESFNGVIWFRKEIEVPEEMLSTPVRLWLGRIVDSDQAYVNGQFVGETAYQYPPRKYDVPQGLLRKGKNVIAVRVICNNGSGEFISDKTYKLIAPDCSVELTGQWKYKVGAFCGPQPETTFVQWQPTGLFNGMLAPVTKYAVRGAVWYQGEANTSKPQEYHGLMRTLVKDWRKRWNQDSLPFVIVQLPNYGVQDKQPSESQWAELREAQLDALCMQDTAVTVNIDLGEWNDLHPLRKKDVGERVALAAGKIAYGEGLVASGPVYRDMEVIGSKIAISFLNTGSGLSTRDGLELRHFAISGKDSGFVWANAKIDGNRVIVWAEGITEPVAVRYAWADNPETANLINMEGLPAAPFRTDRHGK